MRYDHNLVMESYNENKFVSQIALGYRKFINDTYYPVDPSPVDPSPVDPSPVNPSPVNPSPVNPSPVNPSPVNPDQNNGMNGWLVFLIILICIAFATAVVYFGWKYYINKKKEQTQQPTFGLLA